MATYNDNNLIQNREIRIFVSSTFSDMQLEREYLISKVFPTLRKEAASRSVTLTIVDLRWGITKEESENGKVLEICLREIDNCTPFFIGILGGRYGWCPSKDELQKNPALSQSYDWLESDLDKNLSITEIEMRYGVLRRDDDLHACFCIKKDMMPSDVMNSEDQFDRLSNLKDAVRKNVKYPVLEYEEISEMGDFISVRFKSMLDELFPIMDLSAQMKEDVLQKAHIKRLTQYYVADLTLEDRLWTFIHSLESDRLCITGGSGTGKSTLLASLVRRLYGSEDVICLPYFVTEYNNTDTEVVLDYWLYLLGRTCEHDKTEALADAIKEQTRPVVLILDGADIFLKSDNWVINTLKWIPKDDAKFIICSKEYESDDAENLVMPVLNRGQKECIVRKHLEKNAKSLDDDLIGEIVSAPVTDNPRNLSILMSSMISYGSFENIEWFINKFIETSDLSDFYQNYLSYIEEIFGKEYVEDVLCAIAIPHEGLREMRIPEVTGKPMLYWSQLYCNLSSFMASVNSSVRIIDSEMKKAILDRYSDSIASRRSRLCNYLLQILPECENSEREMIWNELAEMYFDAGDTKSMYELFTDLSAFNYFYNKRANSLIAFNGSGKQIYRYWQWMAEVSPELDLSLYFQNDLSSYDEESRLTYYWQVGDVALHMYYVRESIIGFGKLLAGAINSNSARREAMIRSSLLTLSLSFDDMGFMGFASKLSEWKSEFEADGKMPREDDSIWLAINEYITYVSCGEKSMSNLLSMEELMADLSDGYRMDKVRVKEILADSYLEAGEYEKTLDRYRFVISAIEDYIDEEFEYIDNDIIRHLYELYLKLAYVLTSLGKTEEAEEVRQICENMLDNEPALW